MKIKFTYKGKEITWSEWEQSRRERTPFSNQKFEIWALKIIWTVATRACACKREWGHKSSKLWSSIC